ncbi:endo-1,4-beta-xylanase, partial [Klebsiella oxytoca]
MAGKAGSIIYAWDVTNEYLHRDNQPGSKTWMTVYGDMGLEPTYVKNAFQFAYDTLKQYGVQDKVTLF